MRNIKAMQKVLEIIIGLVLVVYLLVQGLGNAFPTNTTLTLGGTSYTWVITIMVIVGIFGLLYHFYKSST